MTVADHPGANVLTAVLNMAEHSPIVVVAARLGHRQSHMATQNVIAQCSAGRASA